MSKMNLADYMAYLEQKVAEKREKEREKAFEEIKRMEQEREKDKAALNDLFRKAGAGSLFNK